VATRKPLRGVPPLRHIVNYWVRQTDRIRQSASVSPKTLNAQAAISHLTVRLCSTQREVTDIEGPDAASDRS